MHFCTRLTGNVKHEEIVSPFNRVAFHSAKNHQDDPRLHNLFYRKSKLESVNETSALLSGFAIVSSI
jgi:hypothetical protein